VQDPFKVIIEFAQLFSTHIKEKNITFTLDRQITGDSSAVKLFKQYGLYLDVNLYKQILYNVFVNACKFNKMGGSIKVSISVFSKLHISKLMVVTKI